MEVINILAQASLRLCSCEVITSCPSSPLCFRTCSPLPTVILSFTSPSPFISRISYTKQNTYIYQNVIFFKKQTNKNTHDLLTCTRPSLFSKVSLLPMVLLSDARRSCTPLSQFQVVCSVSSKACCSCKVTWQLCTLSLMRRSKAWCWDCS